jgi:hypothetical protein
MIISTALIGLVFVLISRYNPSVVNTITEQINHHVIIFCLIRFGIILSIASIWPYFVCAISNRSGFSLEEIAYWQSKRFHMIMWLIVFDVLICQNIIGKLIRLISGY